MTPFDVIATVGPSLFQPGKLEAVAQLGATILRINGAHLDWGNAASLIQQIRARAPGKPILLDISGRKIRLCHISQPLHLHIGECFRLLRNQMNFPQIIEQAKEGTKVSAVDGLIQLVVVRVDPGFIEFEARTGGILSNGKGLHFEQTRLEFPPTSPIEEGQILSVNGLIDLYGLSFVHTAEDIAYFQRLIGDPDTRRILPKIETGEAVSNLESILDRTSVALIDRGDLSSEIGMGKVVKVVRHIIHACKSRGKRIFVATHFLRSMVQNPAPTMSEYFDLHSMLDLNIDGLQFSDETAIGQFPEECLRILQEARESR